MASVPDEDILMRGSKFAIAYATDANGGQPAKEFLESGEVPKKDKAVLATWMQYRCDNLLIANDQKFKRVQDLIYEFKSHQARVLCFNHGPLWLLTNGCIKQQYKHRMQDIERAERIRREHIQRYPDRRLNP